MNKDQARKLVQETFTQKFDKDRFITFIGNLLNHIDVSNATSCNFRRIKDAYKPHIDLSQRVGTYTSPDKDLVDVLIVRLTTHAKLIRTRTAIRNFVADYLAGDGKNAALVAFVSPSEDAWRFSYVKMEYAAAEKPSGELGVETRLTPARRLSYIVGPGESCHTAQTRFLNLLQHTQTNPQLKDIEEAFSVEAVTKEFFERYKLLFLEVKEALDKLATEDKAVGTEFAAKKINTIDFAKKLMGQIVFLYFLQKKGWLGVAKGGEWGTGPHDFLRELVKGNFGKRENFFNDILEPLFYDTLATDRGHEAYCDTFKCRIPFLNGGLFEPLNNYNWRKTAIRLPNELFTNSQPVKSAKGVDEGINGTGILDVFDRYNFTVNEAEPLEKEVAIDPEMLGKVFENLLGVKERKSKGSFYTPREIVHYMCQESLINYLDTAVNKESQLVPRTEIESLIHSGDHIAHYDAVNANHGIEMPPAIKPNARALDNALADITVCDPAIGSGAFPVGMMQEIVRARSALTRLFNDTNERSAYHFKRHAIQNCLYGVDIDPGAVEIAKLRLWLSLVVDEEETKQIKPLPNLDYKVVAGNSLLGFPYATERLENIEKMMEQFFNETDHQTKIALKAKIDGLLIKAFANSKRNLGYAVNFDFKIQFPQVFRDAKGFDLVIANPPYVSHDQVVNEKEHLRRIFKTYTPFADLYCCFIERSLAIAAESGNIAFITSNSYLKAQYGQELREMLSMKADICCLLNLERAQVFSDAIVNTAVLIAKRKQRIKKIDSDMATVSNGVWDSGNFTDFLAQHCFLISANQFAGDPWILERQNVIDIQNKMRAAGEQLDGLGAKIRLGIATGCNEAFLVDAAKRELLSRQGTSCGDIFVPIIRGREINRYGSPNHEYFLIAAKNGVNIPRDYPLIKKHFDSFGEDFRNRGAQGEHYWNLRACAFYEDMCREKIVWIEMSDGPRFTACSGEIWCLNSAYFLLPPKGYNINYLLAILNSKAIHFYFKLIAQTSGMGVPRWINLYVSKFPIPRASPEIRKSLEELAAGVLVAKRGNPAASTGDLEAEIDQLVYRLYDLAPEEITIVEAATTTRGNPVMGEGSRL